LTQIKSRRKRASNIGIFEHILIVLID